MTASEYAAIPGLEYHLAGLSVVGMGKPLKAAPIESGLEAVREMAVRLDGGGYALVFYDPPLPWRK